LLSPSSVAPLMPLRVIERSIASVPTRWRPPSIKTVSPSRDAAMASPGDVNSQPAQTRSSRPCAARGQRLKRKSVPDIHVAILFTESPSSLRAGPETQEGLQDRDGFWSKAPVYALLNDCRDRACCASNHRRQPSVHQVVTGGRRIRRSPLQPAPLFRTRQDRRPSVRQDART